VHYAGPFEFGAGVRWLQFTDAKVFHRVGRSSRGTANDDWRLDRPVHVFACPRSSPRAARAAITRS
jgi:hypothetical protein